MQLYADIYLLLNYSTCFGRPSRPSSGVHKTVVAASGIDHTIWGASFFKRDVHGTFEEAVNKYLHTFASCSISPTQIKLSLFLTMGDAIQANITD